LKRNEKILLGSWLLMLFSILLIVMTLSSCNGGWAIAGVDISPTDSIKTDFMIITDQDSTKHWYIRTTIQGGILVGDNWCHRHERWEKVEKK
tara:strand:+ start:782 stop:1057 length:276 start_codon:yes stop_codon:yes gene_type:complete